MSDEVKYKYSIGDLVYFRQGNRVYRMVIQGAVIDRFSNEPMYCALKPKCEYAMYFAREKNIICNPSRKEIIEAKVMYVFEFILGLFNIGTTHH